MPELEALCINSRCPSRRLCARSPESGASALRPPVWCWHRVPLRADKCDAFLAHPNPPPPTEDSDSLLDLF